MATHEQDDKELTQIQERIDAAKQSSANRSDRVDDLTSRFRELRRKNHFRLMLEEIFHD